ncbi:hypothetical protein [Streptomyces sp. NPDC055506]
MLQPRRYGGYEFGLPVFYRVVTYRVVTEVARGCPSSAWALSLTAAHVLQVASVFGERAQDEIFGADGEFRAAATLEPVAVAQPDGDHVILDGTWPYSSGAPHSTHYVGQTLRAPEKPGDAPGPLVLFCAPREVWTVLDDWHRVLGLRGSDLAAIMIGTAYALGIIHTAYAALQQTAPEWMETCRSNVSGAASFTTAEDNRLALMFLHAGRMAWDVLQGTPSSARQVPGTPGTGSGCATSGTPPPTGRTSAPAWPSPWPGRSAATASGFPPATSH